MSPDIIIRALPNPEYKTNSNKELHFANAKYIVPILQSVYLPPPHTVDISKRIVHLHLHRLGRSRAASSALGAGRRPR
jgi:hypothetical protein